MSRLPAPFPSPRRSLRVLGAAWLLFWVMLISVALEDYRRQGGQAYWQPVLWESSSAVALTVLLLVQRRLTRRFDPLVAQPLRWFARMLAWLPVYWLVFTPAAFSLRHGVYALAGAEYRHEPWGEVVLYESLKISVFYLLFMLIAFGMLSYRAWAEDQLAAAREKAALRQAQLARLTQQMQPHFLFNALNTVSSLMHSDVDKADAVLIQLADTLRAALDAGDQPTTTLDYELRIARGYAAVMLARFGERASIDWDIEPAALACLVPVMSVQPLIENIFKHTVEKRREPTAIQIRATLAEGALLLRLADDGGRLVPGERPGLGLKNLRERLAMLYGDQASLHLSELAPAGVLTELRLPCTC
ncbi:sensor histidine kinase [Massilia sp. TS11]|uniref:sensor histidine kinase n=1 Tax=Massilia sp. TS11 TaxID=2908003 RepID=UPI001EDA38AE|nr:histidine kinase [Massilia sp. TS11]MCG2583259.1 histidine kinase [Massilia sp. TS11]